MKRCFENLDEATKIEKLEVESYRSLTAKLAAKLAAHLKMHKR